MASAFVRPPITASYLGTHALASSSNPTITFPSVPLGSAIDRTLLIVLGVNVATGGSSCTIKVNGVPARIDVKSMPHVAAAVGRIFLPASETVGSIEVTTGNSWRRTISLYEYPGQLLTWEAGYGFLNGNSIGPVSAGALPTGPEGFALGGVTYNQNSNPAWSWTGLPTVDHYVGLNESVARLAPTTGVTIPNVSATVTSGIGGKWLGIAAASYIPMSIPPGVLVYDRFNRVESSGLGTSDSGHLWSQLGTGLIGIAPGGAAAKLVASTDAFAVVECGAPDMSVSLKATVRGPYYAGPVARVVDAQNYYAIRTYTNGAYMQTVRFINGVEYVFPHIDAISNGDVLRIDCFESGESTVINTYRNGNLVRSKTDSEPGRPNGTKAGIRLLDGSTNIRLDNFEVRML